MRKVTKILFYVLLPLAILSTWLIIDKSAAAKEVPHQNHHKLAKTDVRRLTARQYLYLIAAESEKDAKILDRLVQCESGWNLEARNKHSTATSLGQFLDGTWVWTRTAMGRSPDLALRTDAIEHIDTLVYLWARGAGRSHWLESRPCWGNTYARLNGLYAIAAVQ